MKVRAVMTGRVALRGQTLMISTEMMDVKDGSQLWGEQYSRKLADAIAIQEEMAREISERLRLRMTGEEQRLLTRRYTENAEAYELYLKGRYFLNWVADAKNLVRSVEYFQQAIARDPRYALAYVGLADSFWIARSSSIASAIKESYRKVKQPLPPRHSKSMKQFPKHTSHWQWFCNLGTGIGQVQNSISSGPSS